MIWIMHHNDADGRCAAAIVSRLWDSKSDLKFIELDYNMEVPVPSGADDVERIYIVDFSVKPDVMEKLLARGIALRWIDHHKSAQNYPYQYVPGLRDFKDKHLSGCELTWQYLFPDMTMPAAVRLIGDYDTWRLKEAPLSVNFHEGLKLCDTQPGAPIWSTLLGEGEPYLVTTIADEGSLVIKYRDRYAQDIRKSYGYTTYFEGYHAYVVNLYKMGSAAAGNDNLSQYAVVLCYIHDGVRFVVSVYSKHPDVDCSNIAVKYGGGGHKGAAGFTCEVLPWKREAVKV